MGNEDKTENQDFKADDKQQEFQDYKVEDNQDNIKEVDNQETRDGKSNESQEEQVIKPDVTEDIQNSTTENNEHEKDIKKKKKDIESEKSILTENVLDQTESTTLDGNASPQIVQSNENKSAKDTLEDEKVNDAHTTIATSGDDITKGATTENQNETTEITLKEEQKAEIEVSLEKAETNETVESISKDSSKNEIEKAEKESVRADQRKASTTSSTSVGSDYDESQAIVASCMLMDNRPIIIKAARPNGDLEEPSEDQGNESSEVNIAIEEVDGNKEEKAAEEKDAEEMESRLVIALACRNTITNIRSSGSSTSISVIGQEEEQEGEQNKEKVAREEKMVDSLNTSSQPMSQVSLDNSESKYVTSVDIKPDVKVSNNTSQEQST